MDLNLNNNDTNNLNVQNSEIFNNQQLNNGTYVQPQQVNSNMVEQPVQPMTGFQQPIMQEPSVQSTNLFEEGSSNKESLNSKPPKKKNLGLIVGIVVGVTVLIVLVIFLLFGRNGNNGNGIFTGNGASQVITSKDIESYTLENETIWINNAIGITYDIPKKISSSPFNGTTSFSYLHGHSFQYYSNFKIYVETSLEGHINLETLASDIIKEKNSDKYKDVYSFGSNIQPFENEKTKKVKIGNIDTVYFESKILSNEGYEFENTSVSEKNIESKIVGYSFKYNEKYISVYGQLPLVEECDIEKLKQMLQVIINSIKAHDGKSLQELGGNAKEFYDNGFTSFDLKNNISINYYSAHVLNGNLAPKYKKVVIELSSSKFSYYKDWDKTLDGIIKVVDKLKTYDSYFGYQEKSKLKEEEVTINGIKMKHYVFKVMYGTKYGSYVSAYTFVVNDIPFLLAYALSNEIDMSTITKDKTQVIIDQTEVVARSFVDTIRFLNGESFTKYVEVK